MLYLHEYMIILYSLFVSVALVEMSACFENDNLSCYARYYFCNPCEEK
jgi:hypothetical protein